MAKHTAKGIRQNSHFGLSVPSTEQPALADYLGLVHGYEGQDWVCGNFPRRP